LAATGFAAFVGKMIHWIIFSSSLLRLMGLAAIYQAPRTSAPHPAHRIYPYLLKGLAIDRPNRVWCADITYIPVQRGFLYLVAIMDWATRHVLAWRLSNSEPCRAIGPSDNGERTPGSASRPWRRRWLVTARRRS
jgi:transposase InsO family protein